MTQTLARSALALLASTALCVSALPAQAARHHHHHHAGAHKTSHHKRGHGSSAAASEESDAGEGGASGRVVEVTTPGDTYTVKKGDTLAKVADKLDVDVSELKTLNHIRRSAIRPGQVLKTPGETTHAYVARSGDTLAAIAKRFGVSEADIRAENGFTRHPRIRSGEKIRLPEGYRDHGAGQEEAATSRKHLRGRIAAPSEEVGSEGALVARSVTGRVVEVGGGLSRTYRVKKGDTLEKVADKLDVDVAQLKRDNHLKHSLIHPGQVLRAPGPPAKAYVVGPGDTIYSISRRFDVSVEAIRSANGMSRRATIHTGQKLRLPAGYTDRGPITTTIRAPSGEARPPIRETPSPMPSAPRPYTPPPVAPPPVAAVPPSVTSPSDAQISELGRGRFTWPIRGDIISDFGPKAEPGQKNDGINIKAEPGTPVHAAAAGDVVYAGDQVPGFGNLVLLKHADGWVTAYAHLSRIEVKMQQKVTQGEEIGQAGQTGGVSEPQVHFEVRYAANPADRARPIDPKLVLPH